MKSMILPPIEPPIVELPPVALLPGQRAVRALFSPSFHPRVLVTVVVAATQGHLDVVVGDGPERARFVVSPDRGTQLLLEVGALDRGHLAAATDSGLDGMIARGEIIDAGGVFRFAAWRPPRGSAKHAYFALLYEIALQAADAAGDQARRAALEQLHPHLDLGPPLRRYRHRSCVRIFGTLRAPPPPELESEIEVMASSGDPLLFDLSNFEGMAPALHPLFRKVTRRRAPTVYWASPPARAQLAEMGVAAHLVFDDFEDALVTLLEYHGT